MTMENIFESPLQCTGSEKIGFIKLHRGLSNLIQVGIDGHELSRTEIVLLLYIVERTHGFQRYDLRTSFRQIARELGYNDGGHKGLIVAARNLERLGIIEIRSDGNLCVIFIQNNERWSQTTSTRSQTASIVESNCLHSGVKLHPPKNSDWSQTASIVESNCLHSGVKLPPQTLPNIDIYYIDIRNKYCALFPEIQNSSSKLTDIQVSKLFSFFSDETKIKINKKQNKNAVLTMISEISEKENPFLTFVSCISFYFKNSPREGNKYRYRQTEKSIFNNQSSFQSFETILDILYHENESVKRNNEEKEKTHSNPIGNNFNLFNVGGAGNVNGRHRKQRSIPDTQVGYGYGDTVEDLKKKYLK